MATLNGPGVKVLRQYEGPDGKTYVELSTGETLPTDSPDYQDYYSQGILYGEDERGNFYPQEGAHDSLKQYQQLVQNNSFENYMKPYFDDEMTGSIARGLGQSPDKFWEVNPSFKQQYDSQMQQDFVNQFLSQNPMVDGDNGSESRGTYLDRIARDLPDDVRSFITESGNPGVQPSYWADFNRGAYTIGNELLPDWLGGGNKGLSNSIQNDESLTRREQNSKSLAVERGQYGFMERTADELGILSPLAIPAKVVQSVYRPNYSISDAISGTKNDAGILEDVVTDPLTYLTPGASDAASQIPGNLRRLLPEISAVQKRNLTKLAMEEPLRLIPGRERQTNEALASANEWQRNWYNAPETQQRITNISNEMQTEARALDPEIFSPSYEASARKDLWSDFKQNIDDETYNILFQSNRSKLDRLQAGQPHLHERNAGVSYEWSRPETPAPDIYQPSNANQTQGFVNRANLVDDIGSVAVHEGNHNVMTSTMLDYANGDGRAVTDFIQKPFDDAITNESIGSYFTKPEEIYARIQQVRHDAGYQPGQTITPEDLEAFKKVNNSKKFPTVEKHWMDAFNTQDMTNLMNKLPAVGAGIGVPAWLLNQQNEPNQ